MTYLNRLIEKPCEHILEIEDAGKKLKLCDNIEGKLSFEKELIFCNKKSNNVIIHKGSFYKVCLQDLK